MTATGGRTVAHWQWHYLLSVLSEWSRAIDAIMMIPFARVLADGTHRSVLAIANRAATSMAAMAPTPAAEVAAAAIFSTSHI